MPEFLDLTGEKFGRLTALYRVAKGKGGQTRWYCKCDCGGESISPSYYLRTVQKGCKKCTQIGRPTHGLSHLPEFSIWAQMKQRCDNPDCEAYKHYGGRGIRYSPNWINFEVFFKDMGPRPSKKHTLERNDNDGNYEISNCRWATRKEQARNFRHNVILEFQGQKKCISEWGEIYGLKHDTIASRLERGFSIEKALMTPIQVPKNWITLNGEKVTVSMAEKTLGLTPNTIGARLKRGYTEEEAISIPIGVSKKQYYNKA